MKILNKKPKAKKLNPQTCKLDTWGSCSFSHCELKRRPGGGDPEQEKNYNSPRWKALQLSPTKQSKKKLPKA